MYNNIIILLHNALIIYYYHNNGNFPVISVISSYRIHVLHTDNMFYKLQLKKNMDQRTCVWLFYDYDV